jgi:hypothetical protein
MDFPLQNIPEAQKDEQFHLNTINAIMLHHRDYSSFIDSRKKDHENFLIANGEFDHKQYQYVTDMYGMTSPARLVNYPMIMTKLDLLAGELISQPLQYSVMVVNRNAVRKKNEQKMTMAAEVLLRPIRREIEQQLGMPIPDENVGQEVPEDIARYQKLKFRNAIEEMVQVGLTFCIQRWDLKQTFKRGFYDLSITGKEFYKTYIKNGDPYAERLDPRVMIYDLDIDKESLKDSKYAGTENWYTVNEIIERFTLTKAQVDYLEELQQTDVSAQDAETIDSYAYGVGGQDLKIRVLDFQWRSIRMLKHKVSPNEFDPKNPFLKKVKDTYKAKKGEKIIEKPITEIRQATKIGHEMLLDWGVKPNQLRFEENYANTEMDFHGAIKGNFSGNTLSVVDSLKNIQILYNIVMYQIELAMARSGGKSIIYDVSQKPKNMSLKNVIYHAKNSGLIVINSKEEGMQTNNFNQFSQVDFTLSQSVAQMVNMKVMLEETADRLTGISASRAGVQKSGDLVGVTERNVMQSTLITAPLFDIHYRLVGDVLQSMAGLMRTAWAKEGRMANVFGDTGMQTFKIDKSIALPEYGIFIENSGREVQRKQEMMALLERFSSSGNIDPLSIIKAVNAEGSSEVESILTEGLTAIKEQQQAMEERNVEVQEAANEIEGQKIQIPLEVQKMKSDTELQVTQMKLELDSGMQANELEHKENMQTETKNAKLDEIMLAESGEEEVASK